MVCVVSFTETLTELSIIRMFGSTKLVSKLIHCETFTQHMVPCSVKCSCNAISICRVVCLAIVYDYCLISPGG